MTVVTVAVSLDEAGNWIAFGRSDNTAKENSAVVTLLALSNPFRTPRTERRTVQVSVSMEVPADA